MKIQNSIIKITLLILLFNFVFPAFGQAVIHAQSPKVTTTVTPKPSPTPLKPDILPNTGINLTVSPVYLNLRVNPGESVSSQIRVSNENNIKEFLHLKLAKFSPSDTGDTPVIMDATEQDDFIRWLTFETPEFTLDPGQSQIVKFRISVPNSASLGYYYAIRIERIEEQSAGSKQASVVGAPAVSVLLEVRSPNAKRELQIVDFSTDKAIYEYPPVLFQARVSNKGNVHVIPVGDIFIDWGSVKNVASMQANEGRGNVLPGIDRTFSMPWNDSFIYTVPKQENGKVVHDKDGNMVYETKWDFTKADKFRIGKYTAHLLLVYDNGERDIPVEAITSFWIIPWKILLGVLIIVILVLLGLKNIVSGVFRGVKRRK